MSNEFKTLNDTAWEKLFDKYNIIDLVEKNGAYKILSKQINEFREARLMTKFDHKHNLPMIFLKNKLSILPITRGSYIISKAQAYHKFEQKSAVIRQAEFPQYIQSINPQNITSESIAINAAYIANILSDFAGEKVLYPTTSGRMGSEVFKFNISSNDSYTTIPISVTNSQLEIDGGYEGLHSLLLIEAKNAISNDFLIRQLYYPFRLFQGKIEKFIRPIFLVYSNGIFSLYEYKFLEPNNYNSLELAQQQNYTFEKNEINIYELIELAKKVHILPEAEIPFPQADNFNRIINLCELLYENGSLSQEYITYNYDFDGRQTKYYTDAGKYLGLLDKKDTEDKGIYYYLTEKGKGIFKLTLRKRKLAFAKCILEKGIFNKVFFRYIDLAKKPTKADIVTLMKTVNLYNIEAESTYQRRASTISGWINWILYLTHEDIY